MISKNTNSEDPKKITIKFETGENFQILEELTVREVIHKVKRPDISNELDKELEKLIKAHDKKEIEGKNISNPKIKINDQKISPPYKKKLKNLKTDENDFLEFKII